MSPLQLCLILSSLLFCLGLLGALTRSNTILVLLGIELMLNAANLNFIAFWHYGAHPATGLGPVFVLFAIAVAAAEAAVGLAIVLAFYRLKGTVYSDDGDQLKL